jgi:TonB family protein
VRVNVAAAVLMTLAGCAHSATSSEGCPNSTNSDATVRQYASYFNQVKKAVEKEWDPSAALKQQPRARVFAQAYGLYTLLSVTLGADGRLHSAYVNKSSGVSTFDNAAVLASTKSQPFPAPPSGLLKDNVAEFQFGFCVYSGSAPRATPEQAGGSGPPTRP